MLVDLLLYSGADPNQADHDGQSSLELLVTRGDETGCFDRIEAFFVSGQRAEKQQVRTLRVGSLCRAWGYAAVDGQRQGCVLFAHVPPAPPPCCIAVRPPDTG
jgi:hypothetical protein